jgi:hypothetical protein
VAASGVTTTEGTAVKTLPYVTLHHQSAASPLFAILRLQPDMTNTPPTPRV